jgi:exopolysaccharide production protein ExoZ
MLQSLQIGRAVACVLVIVAHAVSICALPKYFDWHRFEPLYGFGPIALDVLFVLSGFIILHVHRRDIGRPDRAARYLYRRAHRVFPAYWVALALVLPIFFLVPSFGDGTQRDPGVIARSFFLLPQPTAQPILAVSWTMSLEIAFYLAFVVLIANRTAGLLLFGSWMAFLLVRPDTGTFAGAFLAHPGFVCILGGMLASEAVHRIRFPRPGLLALAGAGLLAARIAFDASLAANAPWTRVGLGAFGAMLLLAGLAAREQSRPIETPRWLALLGDASYSIYLVHYPVLSVLAKLAKSLRLENLLALELLFAVFVVLATASGILFYWLVERPLRNVARWTDAKPKLAIAAPYEPEAVPLRRAA